MENNVRSGFHHAQYTNRKTERDGIKLNRKHARQTRERECSQRSLRMCKGKNQTNKR